MTVTSAIAHPKAASAAATQPVNTTTSPNLVNNVALGANGYTLPFAPPYYGVISVAVSASAGTPKASDVWFYFLDSAGQSVGSVNLQPTNFQTSSTVVTFTTPVQIAQVQMFSWWNPATALTLEITSITSATTGNLVDGQTMTPAQQAIQLSPTYYYVNEADFSMTATTDKASNAWYYFLTPSGQPAGAANAQPVNYQTGSGSVPLLPPPAIGSVNLQSWWNPARATSLEVNYIPTATTPNFANGQFLGPNATTVSLSANYVVAATVAATAGTQLASDVWFYFFNSAGQSVGSINVQPTDGGTSQTTVSFASPLQISSVQMFSWWNPATAVTLELIYLVGAA